MMYRISMKGDIHRGRNRALSMENMYGTADHLWFHDAIAAQQVADALTRAGYPCGVHAETAKEGPPA